MLKNVAQLALWSPGLFFAMTNTFSYYVGCEERKYEIDYHSGDSSIVYCQVAVTAHGTRKHRLHRFLRNNIEHPWNTGGK